MNKTTYPLVYESDFSKVIGKVEFFTDSLSSAILSLLEESPGKFIVHIDHSINPRDNTAKISELSLAMKHDKKEKVFLDAGVSKNITLKEVIDYVAKEALKKVKEKELLK